MEQGYWALEKGFAALGGQDEMRAGAKLCPAP